MNPSIHQSAHQSITLSVNQSTSQSAQQANSQSGIPSVGPSINQSSNRSGKQDAASTKRQQKSHATKMRPTTKQSFCEHINRQCQILQAKNKTCKNTSDKARLLLSVLQEGKRALTCGHKMTALTNISNRGLCASHVCWSVVYVVSVM